MTSHRSPLVTPLTVLSLTSLPFPPHSLPRRVSNLVVLPRSSDVHGSKEVSP